MPLKKGDLFCVHCSDGWDPLPQIVATAELCLDPYYRTVEKQVPHDLPKSLENSHNGMQCTDNAAAKGITVENHSSLSLNLMQSVEFEDNSPDALLTSCNGSTSANGNANDNTQSMWHGSVNTSTDTLVPVAETKSQNRSKILTPLALNDDTTDAGVSLELKPMTVRSNHIGINATTRSNQLSAINGSNTTVLNPQATISSPLSNNKDEINLNVSNNDNNNASSRDGNGDCISANNNAYVSDNSMEESILILPEHQQLEILFSGKCEMISANVTTSSGSNMTADQLFNPTTTTATTTVALGPSISGNALPFLTAGTSTAAATSVMSSQRRRRTLRLIPSVILLVLAQNNYLSRFSLPGDMRSLPMTPPALTERPQVTISCPDGLAHALSEENIRLHQIVHEHKLREDVLLREIHDMRMALLKKICPNCNNASANTNNDEQVPVVITTATPLQPKSAPQTRLAGYKPQSLFVVPFNLRVAAELIFLKYWLPSQW
ncbi:Myotubularin-related protein 3, partial [Eumeta japonica]